MKNQQEFLEALSRRLADEGKLIEAGWLGLRAVWISPDASAQQVMDTRKAFMAGAQHLFASIMQMMDPDNEPTEADLRRIDLIAAELKTFGDELVVDLATRGRKQ